MTIDEQILALQEQKRKAFEDENARLDELVQSHLTVHFKWLSEDEVRPDIFHPDIGYFRLWRDLSSDAPVEVYNHWQAQCSMFCSGGMTYAYSKSMKKVLGNVGGGYYMLKPCEELWHNPERPGHSWIRTSPRLPWHDETDELVREFFAGMDGWR
jgi:hypothetical protein